MLAPIRGQSFVDTPIFLFHASDDEMIDIDLGRQARDVLASLGVEVIWKEEKQGGHLGMLESGGLEGLVAILGETAHRGLSQMCASCKSYGRTQERAFQL